MVKRVSFEGFKYWSVNKRRDDIHWSQLLSLSDSYDRQIEKKKRKRKILSLSFFSFFLFLGGVEICYSHMSIYQILLSPNYQKQRTKNKGATKTSHKKWKDIVSQFQHSTLFTFFFLIFFSLLVGVFLVDLIASNIFFNLLLCLLLTT